MQTPPTTLPIDDEEENEDREGLRRRGRRNMSTTHLSLIGIIAIVGLPWRTMSSYAEQVSFCRPDARDNGKICNMPMGKVCRDGSCVSACAIGGLHRCRCPHDDDHYCYLCCGDSKTQCQPAHDLDILRPNGEYWERDSCRRCRSMPDGLQCDDNNRERMCRDHRCTDRICYEKEEGEYCDMREENVCMANRCHNPCQTVDNPHMLVCECPETDPRTGMQSDDRCQLCCYDFAAKKCMNAFIKFGIATPEGRPLPRVGLSCRSGGMSCNHYGMCTGEGRRGHHSRILLVLLLPLTTVLVLPNR